MTRVRTDGFTLVEMLAVVLLTAIVIGAAIDFYLDLSRASTAAAERIRDARRAVSVLDRVARDLESATLVVRPKAIDPLDFPWLFLAEARGDAGADRLKFVTRGREPRTSEGRDSDLEVVAYSTTAADDGSLELRRWSAPGLPPNLDRTLPAPDAPGSYVLARGLRSFGVRFLADDGSWKESWDSSQIEQSSQLPLAAEIEVAIATPGEAAGAVAEPSLVRRVLIPVRPLDLEELTGKKKDETAETKPDDQKDDAEKSCVTVAACLAKNPGLAERAGVPANVLQSIGARCFSDYAASFPGVQGCQ